MLLPGRFSTPRNAIHARHYLFLIATSLMLPGLTCPSAAYPTRPGVDLSSLQGDVRALLVFDDGSGSALYAGGDLNLSDNATPIGVAKWDGQSWSRLGDLNGTVTALGEYNGALVAGIAQQAPTSTQPVDTSGVPVAPTGDVYIWRPATNRWELIATATGSDHTLDYWKPISAFTTYQGDLIAAGTFGVSRWDGTNWKPLEGTDGSRVIRDSATVTCVTAYNDKLIAGTSSLSNFGNTISQWDGNAWSVIGDAGWIGLSAGSVNVLAVYNDDLYAGGYFLRLGSDSNSIARWDGTSWSHVGKEQNAFGDGFGVKRDPPLTILSILPGSIEALVVHNNKLIVGGTFEGAGQVTAFNIAIWNGSDWYPIVTGSSNGSPSTVRALASYDGTLVAGGSDGLHTWVTGSALP